MTRAGCALFAESTEVLHSVSYLASAILKVDFEATPIASNLAHSTGRFGKADLIIIEMIELDETRLNFISELSRHEVKPFIIVLQPSNTSIGCEALLAGADDAMVWPGNLYELAVRCLRGLGLPNARDILPANSEKWELAALIAQQAGLSLAEGMILRVLLDHFGDIVSRDDLSLALDQRPWRYGDRKFDVHIAKIRKKLAGSFGPAVWLQTIRSEGYRLSTGEAESLIEILANRRVV